MIMKYYLDAFALVNSINLPLPLPVLVASDSFNNPTLVCQELLDRLVFDFIMTKVTRKSVKQNRVKVTVTPRTKGRKKRKTFIPLRCPSHFKVPKTRMKKSESFRGPKKMCQSYSVHTKKRKRPIRPTIYVCYHLLSKKWKERKAKKQNKKRCLSKKRSQHKRRCQSKKQKIRPIFRQPRNR
ncbi:hypothetical protein H671_xg20544 [Cricetulus griseus]|uniref:Uncharacterized protein n=2 Tax=Cricetulus griseus TaxID=10029 RepID=A0A061HXI9_CRIGR|nr:hypothetical protein H671_xg20544 [Cricetulus griseus]